MEGLLAVPGDEVQDVDEETFPLFSQTSSLPDLGMLDPKADILELLVGGRDFTITQSPGALQSNRKGGTTGAAVWQTSVRVAEWLASPQNVLFTRSLLDGASTVLELGSGISGLVPCVLAPKVATVIATDQQHVLKLMRENIAANSSRPQPRSKTLSRGAAQQRHSSNVAHQQAASNNVKPLPLDWEDDDVQATLTSHGFETGVDVVIACDCIYNYALVEPLMQTCLEICRLRRQREDHDGNSQANDNRPTMCVIAQQLRQAEVFEQWLQTTIRWFRVWRVPDDVLTEGLRGGSGFAVHLCILRDGG